MSWYDVVVVGAGAAGAPLAARLSEDPDRQVLLVEAGPDFATTEEFPADLLNSALLSGARPGHPNNWAFSAQLTKHLPYSVARGKVLGGSTSLNGTYYIRARPADFDHLVAMGLTEWSYEKVLPYYKKQEKDLDYGETAIHGGQGPMPVYRDLKNPHPLTVAFGDASAELGFAEELDKNGESQPGCGPLPTNVLNGMRVNTGIAYINPHRDRKNLTVEGDTVARRILFSGTRATGLEVETAGRVNAIEADEIVLSAGAIKSPHLLAISGIGPRKQLEAVGIEVICDLPGVGKEFADHPNIPMTWKPRGRLDTGDQRNSFESVLNFTATGSSYVGDMEILPTLRPMAEMMGMGARARISGMMQILNPPFRTLQTMTGISLRRFLQQAVHRNDLFFGISVQRAESRGNLTITSSDPNVQPTIDYNYLSTEPDLRRMRELVRTAVAILHTPAFKPFFKELGELPERTIDDNRALNAWMLAHLTTAIHTCGTCKMGPEGDLGAVVDQYGRVYGVSRVRVADTSILPFTPSRGPAATATMIGERVADFMKAESARTFIPERH
jgi:choline dehydrogenase